MLYRDGALLDKVFSDELRAELVTFNQEANVFGYWSMAVKWTGEGQLPAQLRAMVSAMWLATHTTVHVTQ